MLMIKRCANGEVVFTIHGRLSAEHVNELRMLLAAEAPGRALILDLRGLVLVDRDVVEYLGNCARNGIELRNCPPYVRAWMTDEPEGS